MKACILVIALLQGILGEPACNDKMGSCKGAAKAGYCVIRPSTMNLYCCASCNGVKNKPANKGGPLNQEEIKMCLASVNGKRARHLNTGPLVWDKGLASSAQRFAESLLKAKVNGRPIDDVIDNVNRKGEGETIYFRTSLRVPTCSDATKIWYDEINNYSYSTTLSKNGLVIGDFIQLVWRKTTRMGVGIAVAPRPSEGGGYKLTFIVARYIPRGNIYKTGRKGITGSENVSPLKRS